MTGAPARRIFRLEMKRLWLLAGLGTAVALGGCNCAALAKPRRADAGSPAASAERRSALQPRSSQSGSTAPSLNGRSSYIAGKIDTFDPRLALVLAYPQRKFAPPGLPSMAERSAAADADPGQKHFADLVRRLVDPAATDQHKQSIEAEPSAIDRMTALALYCDRGSASRRSCLPDAHLATDRAAAIRTRSRTR